MSKSADWSFPSDHGTAAVAVVAEFALHRLPRRAVHFGFLALLICWSRIYVGSLFDRHSRWRRHWRNGCHPGMGFLPRGDPAGSCCDGHSVIDDPDIFRAAKLLIDQHGEDAAIRAAQRADALLDEGDLDGCRAQNQDPAGHAAIW